MSLPLAISAGDAGHIVDHETIHDLLRPQAFDSSFAAMGWRRGAIGSRPAAGTAGRIYEDVAGPTLAYDDSIAWRDVLTSHGSHTWTGIQNFDEDAFFGSGQPWVDVRESTYGAVGDGVANDEPAFTAAISAAYALTVGGSRGAIVWAGPGHYVATAGLPLIRIVDQPGVKIMGAGRGITVFGHTQAVNVVEFTGTVDLYQVGLTNATVAGGNVALKGILATNIKDSVVGRFEINGCKSHGLQVTGGSNLNNVVHDGRISSAAVPVAGAKAAVVDAGTSIRMTNVYFNANQYTACLDIRAHDGGVLTGCIFDGNVLTSCILTSGNYAEFGNWYDTTNIPGGIYLWDWTTDNQLTIVAPRGTITIGRINTTGRDTRYLTVIASDFIYMQGGRKGTYTAGDTTPSVAGDIKWLDVANAAPTTITNLDDGYEGQIVTLHFQDGNTTYNRANSYLDGGANFVATQHDTLTLIKVGISWKEISRSVNS